VTLLHLVPVVAAAVARGGWPALAGAVAADLLVNFFVAPYHTLVVYSPGNAIVLVVHVLVVATVALAVEVAAVSGTASPRSAGAGRIERVKNGPGGVKFA
jgi:K+-sensing histidine kinase KdpD